MKNDHLHKEIALRLTAGEASVLRAILRHVGGNPDITRRGDCIRIAEKLDALGVKAFPASRELRGSIEFGPRIEVTP